MSQTPFANAYLHGLGLGSNIAADARSAQQRDEALQWQIAQDELAAAQFQQTFGHRTQQDALDNIFRDRAFNYRANQDVLDNRFRDEALQLRATQDAGELDLRAQALKQQQEQDQYQKTIDDAEARAEAQIYGQLSGINPYTEMQPPKGQFGPPVQVANPEYSKAVDSFRQMSPALRSRAIVGLQERQWAREDEQRKKVEDLQAQRDMERQLKESGLDGPHETAVVKAMLAAKSKGLPFTREDAIQAHRDSVRGELADKANVAEHVARSASQQFNDAASFVQAIDEKVLSAQRDERFVESVKATMQFPTENPWFGAERITITPAEQQQQIQDEVRRRVMSSFSPQVLEQYRRLTEGGGLQSMAAQRDRAFGGVNDAYGRLQKTYQETPPQDDEVEAPRRTIGPDAPQGPAGAKAGSPWVDTNAVSNTRMAGTEPGQVVSREEDVGHREWALSADERGTAVWWGGKKAFQVPPGASTGQVAAQLKAAGIPRQQAEQILREMHRGGDW